MAASIIQSVRPCHKAFFRGTALTLRQNNVKQWKTNPFRLMSTEQAPKKNYNYVRIGIGLGFVVGGGLLYVYSTVVPKFVRKIHSTGLVDEKKKVDVNLDAIKKTS